VFRASMEQKLLSIFGLKKVTFSMPDPAALEQTIIFVDIQKCVTRTSRGKEFSRAHGTISIFSDSDRIPFGFYAKKINQASPVDTKGFFFYNFDQNEKYNGKLVERKIDFIYLHDAPYNPETGTITSVEFIENEE
jgi:hypothetical protein